MIWIKELLGKKACDEFHVYRGVGRSRPRMLAILARTSSTDNRGGNLGWMTCGDCGSDEARYSDPDTMSKKPFMFLDLSFPSFNLCPPKSLHLSRVP